MGETTLRRREEGQLTSGSVVSDRSCGDEIGIEPALALQYAPAGRREALLALWQLDARLRRIFVSMREPALAEIKLAWWQERLSTLRTDAIPPEPLLQRLAGATALTPADLTKLAEGWRALLAEQVCVKELGDYARLRGQGLVRAGIDALGGVATESMLCGGEGFALVDYAAERPNHDMRDAAMHAARERFRQAGRLTWAHATRPVGMIVELARGDAMRGVPGKSGSPVRVARMAWHALSGR